MTDYEIGGVSFEDGSFAIEYIALPDDVRVNGKVAKTSRINVRATSGDYAEHYEDFMRLAQRVLRDVLEDFDDSDPYIPEEPDDERDDAPIRGMGDG